jgi:hypothetical protein
MPNNAKPSGVDPKHKLPANAFDKPDGYSGQDYHIDRERKEGEQHPSGEVDPDASREPALEEDNVIPPENGRRAFFDAKTGAVHGSGAGAGDGIPARTSPATRRPIGQAAAWLKRRELNDGRSR